MSQTKASDFELHCRTVAERLGKPIKLVKEIVNHYYGGVHKLTSDKMGVSFILPEIGMLHFNMRNVDYPIRRLERQVFFYANVYMHKTRIHNKHMVHIYRSRVTLRRILRDYCRQYVFFICCALTRFEDNYNNRPRTHRWAKTYANYEKAPFKLAVILGNLLRLERILTVPFSQQFFKESDRLKKKALRFMFQEGILDKFKNLEPPFSLYRDLREMRLRIDSENSQPQEQMSA